MRNFLFVAIVFCASFMPACASQKLTGEAGPEWVGNMHRISAAHLKLVNLASQPKEFRNSAKRDSVKAASNELVSAAAAVLNDDKAPNADPLIAHNARSFALEVRQASAAFDAGDYEWARHSLLRMSSYCISCHTRTDRGVKDFALSWNLDLKGFSKSQSLEILLANRSYWSALNAAVELAGDAALADSDPQGWLKALEKALALAVRVNNDPVVSAKIAKAVIANKSSPHHIRRDASRWLSDIRVWEMEGGSRKAHFTQANAIRLIKLASKEGLNDRSVLILNLRASAILHELLARTSAKNYAEVLFFAGVVEASLKDINSAGSDQAYFEACIREVPHSELSERCFARYESLARAADPYLQLDPERDYELTNKIDSLRVLAEVVDPFENPMWNRQWWEYYESEQDKREKGHQKK